MVRQRSFVSIFGEEWSGEEGKKCQTWFLFFLRFNAQRNLNSHIRVLSKTAQLNANAEFRINLDENDATSQAESFLGLKESLCAAELESKP